MRCLNNTGVKKNKGLEKSPYYSAIIEAHNVNICTLASSLHCTYCYISPIHCSRLLAAFTFPFLSGLVLEEEKKSKWVIHYDPKISRKAESIIPLLLLFKSSPQSFPPPTPQSSPPPPVMVDAHLTSTVPPLTDTQLFALLKN